MGEPIKHEVIINMTPPPPPMPPQVQMALAAFMACRNCNTIMQRGTQCPNCGAWCR